MFKVFNRINKRVTSFTNKGEFLLLGKSILINKVDINQVLAHHPLENIITLEADSGTYAIALESKEECDASFELLTHYLSE